MAKHYMNMPRCIILTFPKCLDFLLLFFQRMWSQTPELLHLPAGFVEEQHTSINSYSHAQVPCLIAAHNYILYSINMHKLYIQDICSIHLYSIQYLGLILCLFYQFQWDYSFCIKDLGVTSLIFLIDMVLLNPFNWIHFINSETDTDTWKEYGLNKWANIHHFYSTQYGFSLKSVVTSQNKCILIPSDLFPLPPLLCHSWMHLSKSIGIYRSQFSFKSLKDSLNISLAPTAH